MSARFRLSDPVHLLALGLGSGLSPWAPGTAGTFAAIPLFALLLLLPLPLYLAATLLAAVAGVAICGRASADVGVHDHPAIVWDEIAGFLVAALPLAAGAWAFHPVVDVALVLALFRLLDAAKPGPIGWLERRLDGGTGIMADDLAAGVGVAVLWWGGVALLGGG